MSDNTKRFDRGSHSGIPVFNRGTSLGSRNSRELALFFRIRRMTVVTMLIGSAMIMAAVCASLCMFAFAMHNTITTDFAGVARYCGLIAFGLVTVCALKFTTTMLSEAFKATSAVHAALSTQSLRAFLGGMPKTTTASSTQQGVVIEHFWRAPCTVDATQPTEPLATEPVANATPVNCVEIQQTSAPKITGDTAEAGGAAVSSTPSSAICPSSTSSQDVDTHTVAHS